MGIPVYFKTLISQYQDDILVKTHLSGIQTLCLDLNCLIHPCCQRVAHKDEISENAMMDEIVEGIETLVQYTGVSKTLYIAIDGVCPKAKMKQQRERRHKSVFQDKPWDTNAISPGTYFMNRLNDVLKTWTSENSSSLTIVLNDSTIPGEGEHKLLEYLRGNADPGKTVIYGLDADLIMLGLVSGLRDLYLLRERTAYNIEDTESPYIYLKIQELSEYIAKDINICSKISPDVIINDYVFLCFLLGNDFINHSPSLSLRYGGLETLLTIYRNLQERYQGYYRLIDTRISTCIHLPFFKELLGELAKTEDRRLQTIKRSREKQRHRLMREYGSLYNTLKPQITDSRIKHSQMETFAKDTKDPEIARKMFENLPILCESAQSSRKSAHSSGKSGKEERELSEDFLDSLVWTAIYYFKGCEDWRWCTNYSEGPTMRDFAQYVRDIPSLCKPEKRNSLTIPEQLQYIFPFQSHKLHPHIILGVSVTKDLEYDLRDKRYLWECPISLR